MMTNKNKNYKIGILYGVGPETEMLAQKFVGHLINSDDFCKACENLELDIKCDKCREHLKSHANSIYFYEQVGKNLPAFVEEPEEYLPKSLPPVDFLLVVGIQQDLLGGLPDYLKSKGIYLMETSKDLYIDEPCVVSLWIGELGWFLQRWQGSPV